MKTIALLAAVAALLAPLASRAHGDGLSYEAETGGYFVDIGYDEAVAVEPVTFDLGVFDAKSRDRVDFDYAWVRIDRAGEVVFAGPVSSMEFGKPGFTTTFPEAGEHVASVKFVDAGKTLVEASFPFQVRAAQEERRSGSLLVVGALAVAALFFCVGRISNRHA